jgi:hypothetical protein
VTSNLNVTVCPVSGNQVEPVLYSRRALTVIVDPQAPLDGEMSWIRVGCPSVNVLRAEAPELRAKR